MIDDILKDYSVRELQIASSKILSEHDATNNFIKQFKADHDSQQFYKNVIKWYIEKYQKFPEDILQFNFTPNNGGLGDRFIMTSNILNTISTYKCTGNVNFYIGTEKTEQWRDYRRLHLTDFYEVIDFFHFKRPEQKIVTHIKHAFMDHNDAMTLNNEIMYSPKAYYWPIDFDFKPKTIISYMFYMDQKVHKSITENMFEEFVSIVEQYSNLKFLRLEDLNFLKNVDLLSQSYMLIASEGMWTHLSRAMKVDTIAFTDLKEFIYEFNSQGHFCSGVFDECLNKLKEKCINLTK